MRTPPPLVKTERTTTTPKESPGEPVIDVYSANEKLVAEEVKKAVCEICNFFHSFLETLMNKKKLLKGQS